MTVATSEGVDEALAAAQRAQELTPAQQAMAVSVALAAAAQAGVKVRARAWLAGRFDRVAFCYAAGQQLLQAIAKALLAGEHFAELEWQHTAQPKIIAAGEHERIVRAFDTITRPVQAQRVGVMLPDFQTSDESMPSPDELVAELEMRLDRLVSAEVVRAGRSGYVEAVAQAVDGDPGYEWRFQTDADPCDRCLALAAKTFPTAEAAPPNGAHPNCQCTLEVEMK